ncbi:MAG TPA: methyltransferase domain-containing protein [Actinomycetota bacterium]|nr:methyltransferase domain-containing protein [Actinomycetota bacterium]
MELKAVLETVLYYRGDEEGSMSSFYRDVLGLEQVSDVAFRLGDSLVLLFESEQSSVQSWPPAHGAVGPGHACFLCEPRDYDGWKSRLQARGVAIVDEITWNEQIVSFYFNDPAGNVLEISQGNMWPLGSRGGTGSSEPAQVAIAETISYLKGVLPAPPARVLDVGCGNGELLHALGAESYAVFGIDTDAESIARAEARGGRAIEADFLSFEHQPFDVVFFGRSLHHIFPLSAALERAQQLLVPGGLLVAEEFAIESVDTTTARWLYDLDSVLQAAELLRTDEPPHHAGHHEPSNSTGPRGHADMHDPLERWRIEHEYDPPLTTGEDMVAAIAASFEVRLIERVPYLYRSFCERLEASARGTAVGSRVLELESAGIASGNLVAAGLRVVASSAAAKR